MKRVLLWIVSLGIFALALGSIVLPYWFPLGTSNKFIYLILNHFCCDNAKNYYTALSYGFGVIFGTIGLFLGYFYYTNRKKFESDIKRMENRRAHLNLFIQELNDYDLTVQKNINFSFGNQSELDQIRSDKERHFEIIQDMMEDGLRLLGFSRNDVSAIIRVNSFVDKNELISHLTFPDLTRNSLQNQKLRYLDLIRKARRAAFLRLS